jgi:hypothetical protein
MQPDFYLRDEVNLNSRLAYFVVHEGLFFATQNLASRPPVLCLVPSYLKVGFLVLKYQLANRQLRGQMFKVVLKF